MKPRRDNFNVNEYRKGPEAASRYERQITLQDIAYISQKNTKSIDAQVEGIVVQLFNKVESTGDDVLRRIGF